MAEVTEQRTRTDADLAVTRVPRWRWVGPALLVLAWLLVGGLAGPMAGKASEVQQNDNAAYLPESAESTQVSELLARFEEAESIPAIMVYERDGGLRASDRAEVAADAEEIRRSFGADLVGDVVGPVPSDDGEALQLIVPLAGTDSVAMADEIDRLRDLAQDTDGLTAHVTGPGGVLADLLGIFDQVDTFLVLVTASVVLVILILVYRSPFLPLVVLGSAGLALGLSNAVVYLLAREDVVTLSGQNQGILNVLVLGAGTDYALLLVARFREELRRQPDRRAFPDQARQVGRLRFAWQGSYLAMRKAWRSAYEPILASGGTVILGLLCLLVSDLGINRYLGPIGAIGIASALLVMLTFLPAVLVLIGRGVFWPFRPRYGSRAVEQRGIWARVARTVDRRPRVIWVATTLVLLVAAIGSLRLHANGIPQTEAFLSNVDSKAGQKVLAAHYPAGVGNPAIVIADADAVDDVVAVAEDADGVESVAPYAENPVPGTASEPKVVDGLVRVDVTLSDEPDSRAAAQTVQRLRDALRDVPGADAKVGGFTAVDVDVQETSRQDRNLIIPLVLGVVLLILMALLRSVVAPVLLIATVVLSFLATLGVSAVVFQDLLGWPGTDAVMPLYAFVFLVALGVDYNIFLMTRVREEALARGTRAGTLRGLTLTGGVITSAGAVLAATFSALGVLPMMFLVQMAFMVAFGVLLDTLVVRSLLVPALTIDVGRRVWWPSPLARGAD